MNHWSISAVSGLVLTGAFAFVASSRPRPQYHPSEFIDANRPECPHSYDTIPAPAEQEIVNGPMVPVPAILIGGVFSLASRIPEFNDCQRIILESGDRYGPLMSVFASDVLGHVRFAKGASTETRAIAAVQVLNYAPGFYYKPLGIGPLFNCLYLAGYPGQWRAVMVQMREVNTCEPTRNIGSITGGTPLAVIEAPSPTQFQHDYDVPAAARWGWDGTNNVQYIGLRCGTAWCHVGPADHDGRPGFIPERAYISPAAATDRVRSVLGWYDVQRLGMVRNVSGRTEIQVSGVTGYVFPAPDLAKHPTPQDFPRFIPVAYVALETTSPTDPAVAYYKRKFNYDVLRHGSPLDRMTELALCYGSWKSCGANLSTSWVVRASCVRAGGFDVLVTSTDKHWWALLTSRLSRPPIVRCVTQRLHDPVPDNMPATTRWRWIATDETTWDYCTSGCCETEGDRPGGT